MNEGWVVLPRAAALVQDRVSGKIRCSLVPLFQLRAALRLMVQKSDTEASLQAWESQGSVASIGFLQDRHAQNFYSSWFDVVESGSTV